MNIQNIQNASGLFRTVDGKSDSRKGNISAERDPAVPEINLSEAEENPSPDRSDAFKEKTDGLEMFYPPFFPMGNTQGIFMVEVDPDSASPDSVKVQKAIDRQDNVADKEAVAARQPVASDKDGLIKNNAPVEKQTAHPGSVLDLKV